MGSILAIDYGLKRIGFAVSDAEKKFAFPCGIIKNKGYDYILSYIKKLIKEKNIDLIIVGIPYNMPEVSTLKSDMTNLVENFVRMLTKSLKLPVKTVNERLSSFCAEENLKEAGLNSKSSRGLIDVEAARIMLEEYLEKSKEDIS